MFLADIASKPIKKPKTKGTYYNYTYFSMLSLRFSYFSFYLKLVGRPGNVTQEEYIEKFEKYTAEIRVNGCLAKWNSPVYAKIAEALNMAGNGSSKTVYLAAKRFVERNLHSPIKSTQESEDNTDGSKSGDVEEYTFFEPNFKISKNDLAYKIDIKNIGLFNYSDSEMKLKSEWSDTLNEIIWNFSRCPCAWSFDKYRTLANETILFGSCRSVKCEAKLFVYTENSRSKLNIVTKKFKRDIKHSEKRAIKGANKEKISAMLKMNKSSFVHAELAEDILESYDSCPAHMPNKATLRKLKQRENDKSHRNPDPITSICILKTESKFHRSITDIGIDPFYCFFTTPEQKEWLRLSTRYKRCILSIDSTGILNKTIHFGTRIFLNVFFLQALQLLHRSIPVYLLQLVV